MPPPPSKRDIDFNFALLDAKLENLRADVNDIKEILRGEYVRRGEFTPVRQVVFGLVGVIMLAVVGALLTLVIRQHDSSVKEIHAEHPATAPRDDPAPP